MRVALRDLSCEEPWRSVAGIYTIRWRLHWQGKSQWETEGSSEWSEAAERATVNRECAAVAMGPLGPCLIAVKDIVKEESGADEADLAFPPRISNAATP